MKMRTRKPTHFFALFSVCLLAGQLALPSGAQDAAPSVDALFARSLKAIRTVNDYQGEFVKRELIGDELKAEKFFFKFARPFKVYLRYIDPHPGQEVLYIRGQNKNRIKAHKGSFPDITVNLSVYGRQAMKNSHQPITTFGVQQQIEIMDHIYRKAAARGDAKYTVSDGGIFLGEPVWKVEAHLPSTGDTVKVRESEDGNLWAFSRRVGQTMYVILHYNDDIDSPKDIDEGDEVFVPHHYGSRLRYLIGKKSLMPLQETSWDHRGRVYESYDYTVLDLSPGLTAKDFDPDNEAYDF
jgi:outer membrane lipoprotein-sorting protein